MNIRPVVITKKALDQVLEIKSMKKIPAGYGLRIGTAERGVSCGAMNYVLGFDKMTDADICYNDGGVSIIVKKIEAVHLAGLTLDYISQDDTMGFSFSRKS